MRNEASFRHPYSAPQHIDEVDSTSAVEIETVESITRAKNFQFRKYYEISLKSGRMWQHVLYFPYAFNRSKWQYFKDLLATSPWNFPAGGAAREVLKSKQ